MPAQRISLATPQPPPPTGEGLNARAAAMLHALEQRLGPDAPTIIMQTLPWLCNVVVLAGCTAFGYFSLANFLVYLTMLPLLAGALAALRRLAPRFGMPDGVRIGTAFALSLLPGVFACYQAEHVTTRAAFVSMALTPMAYGVLTLDTRRMLMVGGLMLGTYLGVLAALHGNRPGVLSNPGDALVGVAMAMCVVGLSLLCGHLYALRRRLDGRSAQLRDAMARLSDLAMRDDLTGLVNRRSLMQHLQQAIESGVPCSVALVDIDHFKRVNDQHGHHIGDEVLRRVAAAGQAAIANEPRALFGRWGGEEFMLLLAGHDARAAALPIDRLHQAIGAVGLGDIAPPLRVTASIGLATRRGGEALAELLAGADEALYEAKAGGRDRVCRREDRCEAWR